MPLTTTFEHLGASATIGYQVRRESSRSTGIPQEPGDQPSACANDRSKSRGSKCIILQVMKDGQSSFIYVLKVWHYVYRREAYVIL